MFSLFRIHGHSMEPAGREGDIVFVHFFSYLFSSPKIGDIVVVEYPSKFSQLLKRIAKIKRSEKEWEYWILGDNVLDSQDSRTFGWIQRKMILGKAHVFAALSFPKLSTRQQS